MKIKGCTALVTGSNQGIGRGFVEVLLKQGARRIYATARRLETLAPMVALDPDRIVPLALDVLDPAHRAAAAETARDVNLLINNAGIPGSKDPKERQFIAASSLEDARAVFETNLWAPAEIARLFAPALIANAPAAIINVISIGALFCLPEYASYCAAKSATAIMTTGLRAELGHRGVHVAGVFTGAVDTRMAAPGDYPKSSPAEHAAEVFAAIEAGEEDIFAGKGAPEMRDAIRADPKGFERGMIERYRTKPMGSVG
jgi:NAD(P)-dependent dehydrogenase (short-subunit alcohol dehydrogenase family)